MIAHKISHLQAAGFLGTMDAQVAGLAARVNPEATEPALLAAALASRAIRLGHACADLADYAGRSWADILADERPETHAGDDPDAPEGPADSENDANLGNLPSLPAWRKALDPVLFGSGPETGKDRTLFVQKDGRVYLRRYWDYERKVECKLIRLNTPTGATVDDARLSDYFKKDEIDQRAAARKAIGNRLSLLSGGPGTGKTYTLARAVALLGELNLENGRTLNVRMVAPTGKAAVRMAESIRKAKAELLREGKTAEVLKTIPEEATTIHRLLESCYHSPYFKHDGRNPVQADMVIVDEASMVDLPLMAKLLDALPDHCTLMLAGDIDQLASVEPGRVYGDVCHAAEQGGPLAGCLTRLTRSWRFPDDSAIGRISRLINEGKANEAWKTLKEAGTDEQLQVLEAAGLDDRNPDFIKLVLTQMAGFMKAKDAQAALAAAGKFRILCALRNGPYGVNHMNLQVEKILAKAGLEPGRGFYDHQLIMIRVNTPALSIYNGDVGVILARQGDRKTLEAWFPDAEQGVRSIPVGLLPDHETAFAMTIHKSQGSEFQCVALVLPDNADSPVLTRELLYTGMTRVAIDEKNTTGKLILWCSDKSLVAAVRKQTTRTTGLFKTESPP